MLHLIMILVKVILQQYFLPPLGQVSGQDPITCYGSECLVFDVKGSL